MTARYGSRLAAIGATALLTAAVFVLPAKAETDAKAVIKTYSDIALAKYEDSLTTAQALDKAVDALLAAPSVEPLNAARDAWKASRVPYQQTEVYRFGNKIVDDWEGKVNSWPLDEGLIDYVAKSYGTESDANALYTANVIANKEIEINGKKVDASKLSPEFLSGTLQGAGGIEANVATGYHAIEFLLWGQDLHGTGPGAGERPYTDYDLKNCTGGNCDRRAEYLKSASDLLVSDIQEMVGNWKEDGAARKALVDGEPNTAISTIFTGMGSLSYGELAGERMKLGLLLHDPEEEHDCFSDNTYNSHLYDAIGIRAAYHASYTRLDGTVVSGPSVADMVKAADPAIDKELSDKLDVTVAKMEAIKARALAGEAYDQQIAEGNVEGNATVQAAIDALIDQTKSIERAVGSLKLSTIAFEGSDSLDAPDKVFK
ncbi:peptidase [Mesorhizobium sp. M7A.F.Ca.CA.001.07.2.1]|uniref:imelysin family protein n=6 Tax=Phyllobacteriaceae TaxID=69277 RepID=UPI000FCC204E|nr:MULTISPECIES: imelysin family protein [Mesorhizobium]MCF6126477.1 imelysin family protein [Mesorhizobium ciceri]MCQ8817212.1 imelysin family protein [Mesorhizobium sp. SEMIA396]RUX78320.1 peptidase [Mesorhizobium sp. M7A.F.Ca.CA.004.08.2.1]RUX87866.1 peptidase [Mesorhizobium sp. M7A.F.Ca.CA.004.08.1.1]RUY04749.1 peptidase [Mesorhizobium sp. M7A.F.Ca.CA.004.04.1.1]